MTDDESRRVWMAQALGRAEAFIEAAQQAATEIRGSQTTDRASKALDELDNLLSKAMTAVTEPFRD